MEGADRFIHVIVSSIMYIYLCTCIRLDRMIYLVILQYVDGEVGQELGQTITEGDVIPDAEFFEIVCPVPDLGDALNKPRYSSRLSLI